MGLSNLPPGVTDSMIPGNRPEDIRWEKAAEQVEPEEVTEACRQYAPSCDNAVWRGQEFNYCLSGAVDHDQQCVDSEMQECKCFERLVRKYEED